MNSKSIMYYIEGIERENAKLKKENAELRKSMGGVKSNSTKRDKTNEIYTGVILPLVAKEGGQREGFRKVHHLLVDDAFNPYIDEILAYHHKYYNETRTKEELQRQKIEKIKNQSHKKPTIMEQVSFTLGMNDIEYIEVHGECRHCERFLGKYDKCLVCGGEI